MTCAPGELMEKYCHGDGAAFVELYRQIAPGLLRYLTSLSRSGATADDVLQETFVKVHRWRASYVRGTNPVPWIYTIARNALFDELRRRRREIAATEEARAWDTGPSETPGSGESGFSRSVAALQQLPWPQREAIVLTKIDGKSFAEAAAIVGVSAGAMKVRAHRGYVALRRALGRA